jgi:hypothetical protein
VEAGVEVRVEVVVVRFQSTVTFICRSAGSSGFACDFATVMLFR